tara:strand:- start:25 stop:138 length:114 start_codon:yes stop_codon:yes gene_type:complete
MNIARDRDKKIGISFIDDRGNSTFAVIGTSRYNIVKA